MAFPSTLTTFAQPSTTSKLNSPSHSNLHNTTSNAVNQIEAVIGLAGAASTLGTIQYDLRSPASDGGGHVQSANKGGTGQTSYTKGDILVASSSSVLSKQAIGTNGFALVADSTAQTGVSWQGVAGATQIQNQQYTYARASVMSASVYGITLSQNPSILTDGMSFAIKFPTTNANSVMALSVNTQSGSVAARLKTSDLADLKAGTIGASMIGIVEFDSVSSIFQLLPSLPTSPTYDAMVFSKNSSDASSTSVIGHLLGKVPSYIKATISGNTTNAGNQIWSTGVFSNSKYAAFYNDGNGNAGLNTTSSLIAYVQTSGSSQTATVSSVTSSNFILVWVKTGSPTNTFNTLLELGA